MTSNEPVAKDRIEIRPSAPVHATIRPPGSKSITNRALICAALAKGNSTLRGALDSEDTRVMIDALRGLDINIQQELSQQTIAVEGCAGNIPADQADLYVANSGTSIRFLTALLTLGRGTYRIDGNQRMQQRPIGDLIFSLNQLGANVKCQRNNDCPPVCIAANGLPGGRATVAGNVSSQFLSGLLMAAPYAENGVELAVEGELVSQPYVRMTLAVMSSFGVVVDQNQVDQNQLNRFSIDAKQGYRGCEYHIEPDASAASYFWSAAAITGGTTKVLGLTREALQGDVAFCRCLEKMGCKVEYESDGITVSGGELRGIEIDMNAMSDTAQTLAVVALFAHGSTTITGIAHNRLKETDRIGDLARELRRLGAEVDELEDGLRITPHKLQAAEIETYHDHRMAMSLSLAGLRLRGVVIKDPSCTAKTYPRFFEDLASMCVTSQ